MSIVLVDMDGVLADTHKTWLDMYNPDYDDNLQVKDITKWAMHDFVKPECGRKIYDYLERPDFYDKTPLIAKALDGVRSLRNFGHRVIFVSAGFFESKVRWLGRMGFITEFPYRNDSRFSTALDVILCNDKSLIRGDYLIDDNPQNIQQFKSRTVDGKGILFTQPWNVDFPAFYRANNWSQVLDIIGEFSFNI